MCAAASSVERELDRRRRRAGWSARRRSALSRAHRIAGIEATSSSRAVASIVWVWAVASGSVCDRVAREKSPKRRRSTTVRQTRSAARIRRARRSTSAIRKLSSSAAVRGRRPSARCAPIERRRRPVCTRRGSRLWASACRWRPAARPSISTRASPRSARRAGRPSRCPRSCSFLRRHLADAPQPLRPAAGAGTPSSPPGSTTSSPSGLATALATLARNFVRATPTEIGSPASSRTRGAARRDLRRRAGDPLHPADVEERLVDRQSLDQRGGVIEDREDRACSPPNRRPSAAGTTTACGHSLRARCPPIAVRTPHARASYDAASTTPPPTITACPRSFGSSRCSTDAKNASRSAWRIVAAAVDTNTCSHRGQPVDRAEPVRPAGPA